MNLRLCCRASSIEQASQHAAKLLSLRRYYFWSAYSAICHLDGWIQNRSNRPGRPFSFCSPVFSSYVVGARLALAAAELAEIDTESCMYRYVARAMKRSRLYVVLTGKLALRIAMHLDQPVSRQLVLGNEYVSNFSRRLQTDLVAPRTKRSSRRFSLIRNHES